MDREPAPIPLHAPIPPHAPTARARIRDLALGVLRQYPTGMAYGELVRQVLVADPTLNPATVRAYIAEAEQTFAGAVYRPARGMFRLVDDREPTGTKSTALPTTDPERQAPSLAPPADSPADARTAALPAAPVATAPVATPPLVTPAAAMVSPPAGSVPAGSVDLGIGVPVPELPLPAVPKPDPEPVPVLPDQPRRLPRDVVQEYVVPVLVASLLAGVGLITAGWLGYAAWVGP